MPVEPLVAVAVEEEGIPAAAAAAGIVDASAVQYALAIGAMAVVTVWLSTLDWARTYGITPPGLIGVPGAGSQKASGRLAPDRAGTDSPGSAHGGGNRSTSHAEQGLAAREDGDGVEAEARVDVVGAAEVDAEAMADAT